jgi:hypothetical protein
MRYTVYLEPNYTQHCETAGEAAEVAVNDPEGGRYMVYDNWKQRFLTGAEVVWAYVNARKRRVPREVCANAT